VKRFQNLICQLALLIAFPILSVGYACASEWPDRPVKLIVPYPAGGGTDVIARILQAPLSEGLGQPVLIENRGGAGGVIGTDAAAKSAGDGYTFLLTLSSHTINPLLSKVPYDVEKDFAPVSLIVSVPQLLAVRSPADFKSITELVVAAKKASGKISYASVGAGTPSHIAGELLNLRAGISLLHVPYKGGGPAMTDVLAGHVSVLIVTLPAAMSNVKAGKLVPLAVTTKVRSAALPDVPTVAEALSIPGYEVDSWYAMFAPASTSTDIVAKMNKVLLRTLQMPEVQRKLQEQGGGKAPTGPDALADTVTSELKQWRALIKEANLKLE
jgi:tripartite-type tricarboxylate transporter receptor subunit TctC